MDRRRNLEFLTHATLAQAAILVCALTSGFLFGGLGTVAFIHKDVEITRQPTKSGRDPIRNV